MDRWWDLPQASIMRLLLPFHLYVQCNFSFLPATVVLQITPADIVQALAHKETVRQDLSLVEKRSQNRRVFELAYIHRD